MAFHIWVKSTLPIAFFGYAAFANIQLFTGEIDAPDLEGFLTGEITQEIDTLYAANLPHRDPSVGLIGALRYALLNEGRDGVVVGQAGWLYTDEEFRPLDEAPFTEVIAWMAAAEAQLAAVGSDLIILPLPGKLDIARDMSPAPDQALRIEGDYDAFLARLAEAGLTALDTRPVFLASDAPFFRTDTHWTAESAASVARHLAETGLLEPGEAAFAKVAQYPLSFSGDLVSFVTTETLAPLIGLAPETVTPYLAVAEAAAEAGALDLFGTSGPAPLALVGTSYSANPNWSFAEALKLALRQDVLNYAEEGFGPLVPMQAFLERLDPAAPPPVVIWEFPVRYLSDPKLMPEPTEAGNA